MTNPNPDHLATTDHPVHDLIRRRWSPYAFSAEDIASEDLRSLFEAARWAPSSFNEQPWRYLVARRSDQAEFAAILTCLVEANQVWARHAGALALTVARTVFSHNGKPNGNARHDIGLASAALTFEAVSRGLAVHQMGGILPDRAREVFGIPEGFEAVTGLAIGKPGHLGDLPAELGDRDRAPRIRRPLAETVYSGAWARPAGFLE